jgi:hypothetical protein
MLSHGRRPGHHVRHVVCPAAGYANRIRAAPAVCVATGSALAFGKRIRFVACTASGTGSGGPAQ